MKRKRVIRCIHSSQLQDIRDGKYKSDEVGVYYGFNNYNRTATQIFSLIRIVRRENPKLKLRDIEVYEITNAQSDRHAHFTMVHVNTKTDVVKANIGNYTTL